MRIPSLGSTRSKLYNRPWAPCASLASPSPSVTASSSQSTLALSNSAPSPATYVLPLTLRELRSLFNQVIKFAAPISSAPPPLITDSDSGILTLLSTLSSLATYIRSIESRIEEQQVQTKAYYAKKQMNLVKSHLVSRKRLEVLLAERVAARDKLGEVLLGIERASGDEEVDRKSVV